MYRYKRLLVGLSLNGQDKATIRYANMVTQMAHSEEIRFVHAVINPDLPEAIREKYPALLEPFDEAKNRMKAVVRDHFGYPGVRVVCKVVEGFPLTELLCQAKEKNTDLILVGRAALGTRTLLKRLVRKAPCSVFIVPEGTLPKVTKILVPVDFSENSADAVDVAVAFASAVGTSDISCLHVFHVPLSYHRTGMTYREFAKVMAEHAANTFEKFISNIDLRGVSVTPIFEPGMDPIEPVVVSISEAIKEQHADLLIMGSRGRSAAAAVLLGSVTERLIKMTEIPLLAVKKKGMNLDLVDAMLR